MDSHSDQIQRMYEVKIKNLQSLLLKHKIPLFPQGVENSQSQYLELIQIIQEDQEFNENMNTEVNNFLAISTDRFREILDYHANFKINEEFVNKEREYEEIKKNISEAQDKINGLQQECLILKAFIGNHLLKDSDKILRLESIYANLNQIKQQGIQEVHNVNIDRNSINEIITLRSPPQPALIVAQIIVVLLDNQASQNNIWAQLKGLIAKPNEFLDKLSKFEIEKQPKDQVTITKNLFETVNEDQCRRCSLFVHHLYKWSSCQFAIAQIYNNKKIEIQEIVNHKQALKFDIQVQDFKQKIYDLQKSIQQYQDYQQPIKQVYEEKAIQVLQTNKYFEELKTIIKPKQYGIKMTNYLIKVLQQQKCTNEQITILLGEIITQIFASCQILYQQTPQQTYQKPIILNNQFLSNKGSGMNLHNILMLIQSPYQFYCDLKSLNQLIQQGTQTKDIEMLLNQICFNYKPYSHQILEKILNLVHQSFQILNQQIGIPLYQILKLINDSKTERKIVLSLVQLIEQQANIKLLHLQQLMYQEMPILHYLIFSYLEENQIQLKFSENQIIKIQNVIIQQNLDIDKSLENILWNLNIILKSKEYYNEVHYQIEEIKQKMTNTKKYTESLAQNRVQSQSLLDKVYASYYEMQRIKKKLEDQIALLKQKDNFLISKSQSLQKFLNKSIHQGMKFNELAIFKNFYKFNPIYCFASKIILIQLGLDSFTPDIVGKCLGSQNIVRRLKALTINNLNENQQYQLEQLLIDNEVQYYYGKSWTAYNLVRRSFRILHLKYFREKYRELLILRCDILNTQKVIQGRLNLINQSISDLEKQLICQLKERVINFQKIFEDTHKQVYTNISQFNKIFFLQQTISKFQSIDATDLSIQLILQNFNNTNKEKDDQKNLAYLIYFSYQQQLKDLSSKQFSKLILLTMYLQRQYKNNTIYFMTINENTGIFKDGKYQTILDAFSYWKFVTNDAIQNINFLIGIFTYQLFYNNYGSIVNAICIQSDANIQMVKDNFKYQIIVLNEILGQKYGIYTLSIILSIIKQVISIYEKIKNIYQILDYQINLDVQKQIESKEFKQEVYALTSCWIEELSI